MTKTEKSRAALVKAMDIVMRNVNNEDYLMTWLSLGVPDGDINIDTSLEEIHANGYTDKELVQEWAGLFLKLMKVAKDDGGLCIS